MKENRGVCEERVAFCQMVRVGAEED